MAQKEKTLVQVLIDGISAIFLPKQTNLELIRLRQL